MITLDQLKKRRKPKVDELLAQISEQVIAADDSGKREIGVDVTGWPNSTVNAVYDRIVDSGYRVELRRGGSSWGCNNPWAHLNIYWS